MDGGACEALSFIQPNLDLCSSRGEPFHCDLPDNAATHSSRYGNIGPDSYPSPPTALLSTSRQTKRIRLSPVRTFVPTGDSLAELHQEEPMLRRPKLEGQFYSCDPAKWANMNKAAQYRYSHAGRIEEGDGEDSTTPCIRCVRDRVPCRKYTPSATRRLKSGKSQVGTSCSRCRVSGQQCKTLEEDPTPKLSKSRITLRSLRAGQEQQIGNEEFLYACILQEEKSRAECLQVLRSQHEAEVMILQEKQEQLQSRLELLEQQITQILKG